MNVFFGGTLKQHIENHTSENGLIKHNITVEKNSFLYSLYGEKSLVNTIHHQAINKVADGFKVTAIAEDGTIEAIENGKLIGIQWHPEVDLEFNIFRKFLELCDK